MALLSQEGHVLPAANSTLSSCNQGWVLLASTMPSFRFCENKIVDIQHPFDTALPAELFDLANAAI